MQTLETHQPPESEAQFTGEGVVQLWKAMDAPARRKLVLLH